MGGVGSTYTQQVTRGVERKREEKPVEIKEASKRRRKSKDDSKQSTGITHLSQNRRNFYKGVREEENIDSEGTIRYMDYRVGEKKKR